MSRVAKWKLEKTKVKVVFRLQFHATHVRMFALYDFNAVHCWSHRHKYNYFSPLFMESFLALLTVFLVGVSLFFG